MKKFTKLWQLMMVILLSSSIAFAQTTVQDAQKGVAEKGYLLKQKQMEKSAIKLTPDGDKVQISFTDPNIEDQAEVTLEQKAIPPTSKAKINSSDLQQLPGSPDPSDAFNWQAYAVSGEETHLNWPSPERATFFEIYDFCLEGPVTIEQVSHLFYEHSSYPWPDATFHFKIYDADGVALLYESEDLEAQNYVEYFYTLSPPVVVTNDFWVAVVPVDASGHPSSMSTADHSGHSYTGSAGAWTVYDGYEFITGAYVEATDAGPRLAVTPDPFDFGPVSLGYSPTQIFTIENYCPAGGSITLDPAPDLTGDAAFTIISDNGAPYPTDIPADQTTVEIEVQFTPTSEQAYSTVLNIYDNLTDNTTSVNITGNGVAAFDCVWEICLHDDYGDGWNGNSLDVFSDGVLVLDDITLADGTGPVCFTFGVNDGATFSTVYTGTAAQWDYENFYYIYDHTGVQVATDPDEVNHGVIPPIGLTDIPTYCGACPGPTDLYANNYGATTADANWTDLNAENLYDIVWGLLGFDPDDALTYTGSFFGYSDAFPGTIYSYTMTGFDWALAPYEFYVRTDCGTDETSPWVGFAPVIPPPPNDVCFNAQPVVGPYPVTGILGTTLGATISCPGVLDMASGDVWYAIDLPYSMNTIVLDLCGDALLNNGWIVGTRIECSCDLAEYDYAVSWNFAAPCVFDLTWVDIPGPATFYYPVATGDFQENFTLDVDVIEQLVIQNDFWVTLDPAGGFVDGGGTDYYGDGWYYYPESTFWNIWFYDHPYDITRYKEIHIEITVDAFDPGFPTYLEFVVNWSTDEWSLVGNPLPEPRVPPLPPLTLPEEDLYIGRELLLLVDDFIPGPEPYVFDFVLPDYNPEWVSIDVLGENFVIDGFIIHECLPKPDPPPVNDDCDDAIFIGGAFPQTVPGTTLGATVDCPGVLDWDAVWYEIDLPYECNFIEIDMCLVNELTLSNTGIILTADCSCDPASFIYSTGEWAVAGNCLNDLNFLVEGPTTVYYPVMSEPKDDFTFDINVTELFRIDGFLTYANGLMSPMQLDEVTIDDGVDVLSTITDLDGYFMFNCVPDGIYVLGGSTTDDWGGLSMNDVQMARQHVTTPGGTLTGMYVLAGDVDEDGFLLMNDVMAMWNEQTAAPPPATGFIHQWFFDDPSVTVAPSATQDFQAICAGDTDGSYVPPGVALGATWMNPIPISYPSDLTLFNQTNCGLFNFEENSELGYYDGGEDIFYLLTLTSDYTVNITVDPKGTTYSGFFIDDDTDFTSVLAMSTNSGGTAHTIEGVFLAAGAYYIMVDTWPSPDCIPDFDLTIEEWVPAYCISGVGPTSTYDSNVETVDITGDAASAIAYLGCTNPTGGGGWLGVEDLTATMSVDVTIGLTYSIDVTFGTCGGSYSGAGEVWIDWMIPNYSFDPGESIGTWSGSPPSLQTFTFTVPAGATTGATRMRVMQHEGGSNPLDPCGGFTWGSVVDFTVNVN